MRLFCAWLLFLQLLVHAKEPAKSIEVEVKAELDSDRETAKHLSNFEKQLVKIRNNFKGVKRNKARGEEFNIKRTENVTTSVTPKEDAGRPFTNFLLKIMTHFMSKSAKEAETYAHVFKRTLTNTFMADCALYMLGSTFVALMTKVSEYIATVPAEYLRERISYVHSFVASRNEKFHKDLNDLFDVVEEQYTGEDVKKFAEVLEDLNNPTKRRADVIRDAVNALVTRPLLRLSPYERDKFAFSLSNVIKNSVFYDVFVKKDAKRVLARNGNRKHEQDGGDVGAFTKLIQNVLQLFN